MRLGMGEMLIVLVVALLIFGPNKLPQLGDALGKGIRNFKKASSADEPDAARPRAEPAQLTEGSVHARTAPASAERGEAQKS